MSYANGAIKTMYIDPVSFVPNGRCAFELDATKLAYLPNMRLLNLGCDNATGPLDYSRGLGAVALIKNCRLMDARTEISALRNVAPYAFFKNMNRSNSINKSNDSFYKRNSLGYDINGLNNNIEHIYNSGKSDTAASGATATAYVDLRELLPALGGGGLPVLPSSVFSNLRIEIEFDANRANQILVTNNSAVTMLRPILAVDYIDDMAVAQPLMDMLDKGIVWNEIQWDNFLIPAVDTSGGGWANDKVAIQTRTNQSMGFKGKSLNRLLIQKQLVDRTQEVTGGNNVNGFGAIASSQALLNETTQVNLNGKPIWSGVNGVNRPNAMLGTVVDAYDELQSFPGSNLYLWNQQGNLNTDTFTGGQAAWSCCEVGARVAELQVTISRNNVKDTGARTPTNSAIQVNLYGEVLKAITFQNGGYSVMFA
tara:strand:- start:1115 stop:2386 length:1272 start_codon:yes stop_codon:yes gene_type:complete